MAKREKVLEDAVALALGALYRHHGERSTELEIAMRVLDGVLPPARSRQLSAEYEAKRGVLDAPVPRH